MKTYEQALNAIAHILRCKERGYSDSIKEYYDDKAWGMCDMVAYIYSCDGHYLTACKVYTKAKELLDEPFEVVYE